jgi:hypothetical protein
LEKDVETVREEHIVKKGLTNITASPFLGLLQLLSDEIMKSPVLVGYINLHIYEMRKSRAEQSSTWWQQIFFGANFAHLVTKKKPNAASTKDFVLGWKNRSTFAIFQGKNNNKKKSEIVRFRQ